MRQITRTYLFNLAQKLADLDTVLLLRFSKERIPAAILARLKSLFGTKSDPALTASAIRPGSLFMGSETAAGKSHSQLSDNGRTMTRWTPANNGSFC
jgi:hypothetical protein